MHNCFSIVVSRQKLPVQLASAPTKLRQMFYTQIERRTFHKKPDSDARSGSGAKRTFAETVMSAKCQEATFGHALLYI